MNSKTFTKTVVISVLLLTFVFGCKKDDDASNNLPTCKITAPLDGQNIIKGDQVTITVDATDSDGNIIEVRFIIDGVGLTATGFPYTYLWETANETVGSHTIKATSIDNSGGATSDEITINITTQVNAPVADFTANTTTGYSPLNVNFTDKSTNIPTFWHWDFGDGNISNTQNPTHDYDVVGNYTVSLTVSNNNGQDTETKQDYIIVIAGSNCPVSLTDPRDGKTYNTVLIGNQCWMKENLNFGTMINGNINQSDNGVSEKYCYDNNANNCDVYGGLYQWDEIMDYTTTAGIQGFCPSGWHIPTDNEWKILEGTVDSQFGVGNAEWNKTAWRGFDAGVNLKSTINWNSGGNGNDLFGFSAFPSGYRRKSDAAFRDLGNSAYLWSSDEFNSTMAWGREFSNLYDQVYRDDGYIYKNNGFAVRCLKD